MGEVRRLRGHVELLALLLVAACSDGGEGEQAAGVSPIASDAAGTGAAGAPGNAGTPPAAPPPTAPAQMSQEPMASGDPAPSAPEPPAGDDEGQGAVDGGGEDDPGAMAGDAEAPRFPPVADLGAAGPYTSATVLGTGPGSGYTVFHPQELAPDGLRNPILTWGNGATTVPGFFALLPHLASHGFVVIASDNAFVTGEELRAGIDWLIEENGRQGSPFFDKLDISNVASFGYSLGSLGTFEIADDPRLTTTVHISGGAMDKSVVPNLENPAAFFCGNASDIAHSNCESDFELATVPVFYGVFPGDHLGILASHTAQLNVAVTGWFRWRLMHDDSLETMFVGPDCTLCTDPAWTVKQKDFDVAP